MSWWRQVQECDTPSWQKKTGNKSLSSERNKLLPHTHTHIHTNIHTHTHIHTLLLFILWIRILVVSLSLVLKPIMLSNHKKFNQSLAFLQHTLNLLKIIAYPEHLSFFYLTLSYHTYLCFSSEPRKSKMIIQRKIDLKYEFLINFNFFLDVLRMKSWREI